MLFNSLPFVVFALIFFPLYFGLSGRARTLLCLVASYVFYGWWDWRFLSLIVISTVVDFAAGRGLGGTEEPRRRRAILAVSLCVNLGILGFFKYFNFFADSVVELFEVVGFRPDALTLDIILPVGISFYTFQTMSYTIDVFRRQMEPEESFLTFAAYVALFPQLVAGPIVRAAQLLPQLHSFPSFDWRRLARGIEMIAFGYFLKVVVADNLGPVVDMRFAHPGDFGGADLGIAVFFFSFQIYGDFAGYSLIAIGLGRIMGLDFGRNFDRPYFSTSFSEFWERWHISLSSWLRDYLYVPLGGNRHGTAKTFRNLVTTMFLGGLWHGANWTFVAWGLLHGAYLVLQRLLGPPYAAFVQRARIPALLSHLSLLLLVFLLTQVAWVFFRSQTVAEALSILGTIATLAPGPGSESAWTGAISQGFVVIASLVVIEIGMSIPAVARRYRETWWLRFAGIQTLTWAVLLFGTFTGQQFIYFEF